MGAAVRGTAAVVAARQDLGHDASGAESYWWDDAASALFGKTHWFLELDVTVAERSPYRITGRFSMPNRLQKVRKLLEAGPRLRPGVVLPVVVDETDLHKVEIDWKRFKDTGGVDQLYLDEAGVGSSLRAFVRELRSNAEPVEPTLPRPTTESHLPVEGIDYDTWITATVALVRDKVPVERHAAHYAAHGFPAGRFDAINAVWWDRVKADECAREWYLYDSAKGNERQQRHD